MSLLPRLASRQFHRIQDAVKPDGIDPQLDRQRAYGRCPFIAFKELCYRKTRCGEMWLRASIGPRRPECRVVNGCESGKRLDARLLFRGKNVRCEPAQAIRSLINLHKAILIIAHGASKTGDHGQWVAQLLEDGIMGDRADFPDLMDFGAGDIELPARFARTGLVEKSLWKRAERPVIGPVIQKMIVKIRNTPIKVEGKTRLGVEHVIVGCAARRHLAFDKPRQRGKSQLGRLEIEISVAALKTHLMFQSNASVLVLVADPWTEHVEGPVDE
jgi:hypothetical protein